VTAHRQGRDGEVPVGGGRVTAGVVRRGDRLLRPMGPWSPAVHEYLRHLQAAGFGGAPRVLRIEGTREVLTFIGGDVANDPGWEPGRGHRLPPYARTAAARRGAAGLIRALHQAAAGFRPANSSCRFCPRPPSAGEIVSHGDLGPWSQVPMNGRATATTAARNSGPPSTWNRIEIVASHSPACIAGLLAVPVRTHRLPSR
jgi:hypothetical protein